MLWITLVLGAFIVAGALIFMAAAKANARANQQAVGRAAAAQETEDAVIRLARQRIELFMKYHRPKDVAGYTAAQSALLDMHSSLRSLAYVRGETIGRNRKRDIAIENFVITASDALAEQLRAVRSPGTA